MGNLILDFAIVCGRPVYLITGAKDSMRKNLNVGGARLTSQYLGGVLLNPT